MNSVEDLWIEIQTKSKPILIGVIYCHSINLKPVVINWTAQIFSHETRL